MKVTKDKQARKWAIKHEGISKPSQWKQSKVDNPLWNKLTYMWPVLPNGELNEAFEWPIEGLLIPNSPPLKKPAGKKSDSCMPLRLKVLKNGEKDKNKAVFILGLDFSTVMKKQKPSPEKKQKAKRLLKMGGNSEKEVYITEFQHFLERCTTALKLPFAARRLFTRNGVEIFVLKDLEQDELIYVSCGEQWIDPEWTIAQHKKRLQLSNLASDVTAIRAYCVMRKTKNLALEVKNDIAVGAKLSVGIATVRFEREKVVEEPDEKQADESTEKIRDNTDKCLHQPKLTEELEKAHHQLFEFRNGKIINCCFPNLLLGVENSDLRSGAEVVLLEKKCDHINQHWIWREDSRTFHLVNDPTLVLAVSMPNILNGYPKIPLEMQGCPVILQKYHGCKNGAANQKWNYIETTKVFTAFYTTILDQEITAANYASICTFSVTNTEKIDQLGYYFLSPCGKEKTDLSTSEAESTLLYLEDVLASLRMETSLQMISEKMSASVNQRAVKIIAYKNGTGYENGQLIIASTFPMVSNNNLKDKQTASKLYTSEGTLILTLQDLVLCAVKDYFRKQDPEERNEGASVIPVFSAKDKMAKEGMNTKSPPSVMTLDDLKLIDDALLTIILRNPIEVWMHLLELQALQFKRSSPVSPKLLTKGDRGLYKQPATKRVWAYANGSTAEQGAHAWGKTITEVPILAYVAADSSRVVAKSAKASPPPENLQCNSKWITPTS
ncbi:hypothetical protein JD844_021681 [Phrynosoma platyrhinos]|uniref:Doublecortin domain-containing protein n=1 Tax=Phrynosoma platyrhinos TaxID=52577 RepID=A0ABQ7STV8_PHRPL|nr:hypothetical protein JD844_021681 [Phrynosoma platyrhinos]